MECQPIKENSKMLELMNAVLVERTKKEVMGKRKVNFKKREIKHAKKDSGVTEVIDWNTVKDKRPITQQIFKPDPSAHKGETPVVALDCEMVEVDRFGEGLARCSIVNSNGCILMDKFVIPEGAVTNYRTWVSGVTPELLKPSNGAIPFKQAKVMAHKLLKGKIIVGHSVKHDFDVIELLEADRPKENVRDLVRFKRYQN